MKYIKKIHIDEIEHAGKILKSYSFYFDEEKAEEQGLSIDELMAEMKEELIKYLEEN